MVATNPGVMCDLSQKAPIVLHESPMLEQVFGHHSATSCDGGETAM